MQLDKILQSQGIGSRSICKRLIQSGVVKVNGQSCSNPKQDFSPDNLTLQINNLTIPFAAQITLALNKPTGYECTRQSACHASVHALLPSHFNNRGIQTAGRLDQDTTGLLIMSDDGQLIHELTHPKKHIPKIYHATLSEPLTESQIAMLTTKGVQLNNENGLFYFNHLTPLTECQYEVVLEQGIYHQVKRMFAAAGSHVEQLSRIGIGSLALKDLALKEGEWKVLLPEQLKQLKSSR